MDRKTYVREVRIMCKVYNFQDCASLRVPMAARKEVGKRPSNHLSDKVAFVPLIDETRNQPHPDLKFMDSDGGQVQARRSQSCGPTRDVRISLSNSDLAQLGYDIGIEEEHQERSAARARSR